MVRHNYLNQSKMLNTTQQSVQDDSIPSDEEIEALFKKVLDTMDLPPDKSKVLWNYDRERKWELIKDQRKVKAKQEPKYYLSKLRSYMDPRASRMAKRRKHIDSSTTSTQMLRDLEISLRTNSIDWVREFLSGKNNGLNILIDYLTFRLIMLQRDLIERKLDQAQKDQACAQNLSSSISVNNGLLSSSDINDLLAYSSSEFSIGSNHGPKSNSPLNNSLETPVGEGRFDNSQINQSMSKNGSNKSSTLSSSSSASTNTNSTFSSKSNNLQAHGYKSISDIKQKRSISSLINTAISNSLLNYNGNSTHNNKINQEMSNRLDETASQLTGNNIQQLTSANQQLKATLDLFPKNHGQKLNLGTVEDDIHVSIMCLRSIMNNKDGFNMVMEHPQAINCLALSLNHNATRTKTLILELLAAICLVKGGHELIIVAFSNFKLVCQERLRFETLIHHLKNQERFDVEFMVSCLQFINIVVHSVDDMNYRTHLQYEFTSLGMDEYLNKLRQSESEDLQVQIQTYLDNRIDVKALAEEAEAKNSAIEQVQQILEELSISNELQRTMQLKKQELELTVQEMSQKRDEMMADIQSFKEQVLRLNDIIDRLKTDNNHKTSRSGHQDLADQIRLLGQDSKQTTEESNKSSNIIIRSQAISSNFRTAAPNPPAPPPPPPVPISTLKSSQSIPCPPPPPPPMLSSLSISHNKGPAPPPPPPPPPQSSNMPLKHPDPIGRLSNGNSKNDPNSANNCDVMTLKKTFRTQNKLPTFNWSALKPNQVKGTVFNEFHDEDKIIKSIDFEEFENQFKLGQKNDNTRGHATNQIDHEHSNSINGIGSDCKPDNNGNYPNSANGPTKRFKQPEKKSFMEQNRLRNMAISLRKLSIPTNQLVMTINKLDVEKISLDCIEILMRMIPNQQEAKAYHEYESQGNSLDLLTDEDVFLYNMCKIERLEQKVKIMFYMKNLEMSPNTNTISSSYSISSSATDSGDLLLSTRTKTENLERASKSLRTSEGIQVILEYILVFGNYLNSSSRSLAAAPAYGFKLQSLDMVIEAKSTQDKSRNLLHFIVETILKNLSPKERAKLTSTDQDSTKPNNIGVGKRISPMGPVDVDSVKMPYDLDTLLSELEQATSISLETLLIETKEFERGMELCIKELQLRKAAAEALEERSEAGSPGKHQPTCDDTIRRLQKFVKLRSCDIIELREFIQRAQKEFHECAQYFGETAKTIESSALFSTFLRFLKAYRQCQVDNKMIEKRKFDEELKRQIQQQQVLRMKKRVGGSGSGEVAVRSDTGDNQLELKDNRVLQQNEVKHGTLDSLITGLKVEPYRRADGMRKSMRRLERL